MADTNDSSSSSTMIVALVAILVIVALGFLLYRQMPTAANNNATAPGADINVNLPTNGNPSSATY